MKYGRVVGVEQQQPPCPKGTLVAVASIATAIQYTWALQISHLNPYVQSLGVPRTFSSLIWVYGAVTGIVVQPIIGYRSDRCTSRFGRRRPYIVSGVVIASFAFMLLGYAKDIGYYAGDTLNGASKPRAVTLFIIGFWLLDIANNTLQGPCRALLADLCLQDHQAMRTSMSWFSFFMAVGNVLGYFLGAYADTHFLLPFTKTESCRKNCANIKTCFFFAMVLLWVLTINALTRVKEVQLKKEYLEQLNKGEQQQQLEEYSWVGNMKCVFKNTKRPVRLLLLVTATNWLALFPILLFGTDWFGKDVFKGKVASGDEVLVERYEVGVRVGSFGLMVNSVVLALASLAVEPAGRWVGGVRRMWGLGNLILAGGYLWTLHITRDAEAWWTTQPNTKYWKFPPTDVMGAAWLVFGVLGISLAVTYSIPFAMASIYCSIYGGGQGLSLGVLNLAIAIPQMIVALMAGPVDAFMGGSSVPLFVIAAVFAITSALLALLVLPYPQEQQEQQEQVTLPSQKKQIIL